MVIQHLNETGKLKKLNKWVPHEPAGNFFKNRHFEMSSSFTLCKNNEPFLNWTVMCNGKWILYKMSWRRSSKALPKAKLATKKVTVWWSAASLIHYSFLNPSEIITSEKYAQQINEMHRKLQCLQLALVSRMDLTVLHDNC